MGSVHQQLQRRQTLLTVDDIPGSQTSRARFCSLEHDRTEEVSGGRAWRGHASLYRSPDVLPQGRPLVVLFPNIWSLEEWDDEVLRKIEEFERRSFSGLHMEILSLDGARR